MIKAILAVDDNGGIGYKGRLPWPNISLDLKKFQKLTTKHHVIMGRKTWDSLPAKFRPLPDRTNWVVTRNKHKYNRVIKPENLIYFTELINAFDSTKDVWIIGGAQVIKHTIPIIKEFRVTRVHNSSHIADTHIDMDKLLKNFDKISEKQHKLIDQTKIVFEIWARHRQP